MRQLRSVLVSIGIVVSALALSSCESSFKPGDCAQNVRNGHVWRIVGVNWIRGYTVQGWFNGKWGLPVEGELSNYDYVKVICPFSTEMMEKIPRNTPP